MNVSRGMRPVETPAAGPRLARAAFTMVEMIMVMGIIIVMLGASIGTIMRLSYRKTSEVGARMLSRELFLCRDYAIIKRQRVALLLPQGTEMTDALYNGGTYGGGPPAPTYGTAMRPCRVTSSGQFVSWIDKTAWILMPKGAFIEVPSGAGALPRVTQDAGNTLGASGGADVTAIIFQPNGSLTVANDIGTTSTNALAVCFHDTVADAHKLRFRLQVNWLTGRTTFEQ